MTNQNKMPKATREKKQDDSENAVKREILLASNNLDVNLFRNNVGSAWMGKAIPDPTYDVGIKITHPRRVDFGLFKGSPDFIGWTKITITPDMVGKTVAIFTGIEAKAKSGGAVSEDQKRFISAIAAAGGLAGVARSEEDFKEIISGKILLT